MCPHPLPSRFPERRKEQRSDLGLQGISCAAGKSGHNVAAKMSPQAAVVLREAMEAAKEQVNAGAKEKVI